MGCWEVAGMIKVTVMKWIIPEHSLRKTHNSKLMVSNVNPGISKFLKIAPEISWGIPDTPFIFVDLTMKKNITLSKFKVKKIAIGGFKSQFFDNLLLENGTPNDQQPYSN